MRILIISDHASPLSLLGGVDSGGQNVYVGKIAAELARRGHHVDIATRRDDPTLPTVVPIAPGARVIHVPAGPARFVRKEALLAYMEEFSSYCSALCDFVSYDLIHANFFMSGRVGLRLKERHKIPLVTTFHALGKVRRLHQGKVDGFPDERVVIEEQLVQLADTIIAECPQDREDLETLYGGKSARIRVIPCGYDPDEMGQVPRESARGRIGVEPTPFVVLQLGRIVRRKGIDTVIEGFSRFYHDSQANTRLLIVGGARDEGCKEEARELKRLRRIVEINQVSELVRFVGPRDRDELKYYYSAADVFVSTPWYEPFGITPVEAMACGTAVIGSRVGGIKSTVLDGQTGFLIPPQDPEALTGRLHLLYRDADLRQRLGDRGRERAASDYTWRSIGKAIDELYREIVAGHRIKQPKFVERRLAIPSPHSQLPQRLGAQPGKDSR
jgi:D-inositol-3-phosphate glycosyltransferase